MFSAIFASFPYETGRVLGPGQPTVVKAHHCQQAGAHPPAPGLDPVSQPKVLTFVQTHFRFSEVSRDFYPKYLKITKKIFFQCCLLTCLTLTMNNSVRHLSSWTTSGKAEAEAILAGGAQRSPGNSPALPGPVPRAQAMFGSP